MRGVKAKQFRKAAKVLNFAKQTEYLSFNYTEKLERLPNGKLHKYKVIKPIRLSPTCAKYTVKKLKRFSV